MIFRVYNYNDEQLEELTRYRSKEDGGTFNTLEVDGTLYIEIDTLDDLMDISDLCTTEIAVAYYPPHCARTSYIKLDGLSAKERQEFEQYKKVMCKPLFELKEELEILEILKNGQVNIHFDLAVKDTYEEYLAGVEGSKVILTEKEWNELKEWLENGKK